MESGQEKPKRVTLIDWDLFVNQTLWFNGKMVPSDYPLDSNTVRSYKGPVLINSWKKIENVPYVTFSFGDGTERVGVSLRSDVAELCFCPIRKLPTRSSNTVMEGFGPDAPTTTSASGAKQSASPVRMDLIPMRSLLHVGKVVKYGADKYGEDNWRGITWKEHMNHALAHAILAILGDQSDAHMDHFVCRAMMAHEMFLVEQATGR